MVRSFVDKNFQIHHWVGKHIIKKWVPRERGWESGRGTESIQASAHCWQSSQTHFRVIQQGMLEGRFLFTVSDGVSIMCLLFILLLYFLSVVSIGKIAWAFILFYLAMLAKYKG